VLFGAGQHDRDRREPAHEWDEGTAGRDPRDLLDHDGEGERAAAGTSVLLGIADGHELVVDEDLVDVPGELVGLVDLGRPDEPDPFLDDLPNDASEFLEL
jgi:hypothetical protein